jgi:hypothetical protein
MPVETGICEPGMECGRPRNLLLLSLFAIKLNEQLYEFDKYRTFLWPMQSKQPTLWSPQRFRFGWFVPLIYWPDYQRELDPVSDADWQAYLLVSLIGDLIFQNSSRRAKAMETSVTASVTSQILHLHVSQVEQTSEETMTHVAGIMALLRSLYWGKITSVAPEANAPPACQWQLKSEFKSVEKGWKLTVTVMKKKWRWWIYFWFYTELELGSYTTI